MWAVGVGMVMASLVLVKRLSDIDPENALTIFPANNDATFGDARKNQDPTGFSSQLLGSR